MLKKPQYNLNLALLFYMFFLIVSFAHAVSLLFVLINSLVLFLMLCGEAEGSFPLCG